MENKYMNKAVEEAKKAYNCGEVPIGAVIVKDGKIIAKAHNIKEKKQVVTKHAELIVIEKASNKLNNWRLNGCDIYITLEPCPMCASAIKQARIDNVYCGLSNSDKNNRKIIDEIFKGDRTNGKVVSYYDLEPKEISVLMNNFFKQRR